MMKKQLLKMSFLLLLMTSKLALAVGVIQEVEFADSSVMDVVRTLSELTDNNIIATPAAAEKQVTIQLKNVSVVDALKSISRISGLWYRYDEDTNTYRLMTREEYSKDLIIRDSEHIEVFRLMNVNVQTVAQAIEDLYGSRVILSLGTPPGANSISGGQSNNRSGSTQRSSRNNRNNRNNSGSNRTSTASGTNESLDKKEVTSDQLEQLIETLQGQTVDNETLQSITSSAQPIYVTVNNEHNMILVRTDDKQIIQAIDTLVKKLDLPVPQVMLEMKILSVVLGEDFNSIFNFELQPRGSNQSLTPTLIGNNALPQSGSFIYEFLNSRLRANIEFLEKNRRVRTLSNPMILASNHRQAELFIGEERVLVRGFSLETVSTGAGGNTGSTITSLVTETELRDVGLTLRITPEINSDGTVTLLLDQEASSVNQDATTLPVQSQNGVIVDLPIDTVNTSRINGNVIAKDGLTVAVGGLIRTTKSNNVKKVPVLGEIPILGKAFRSTLESEEKTETVLLITPHIMNVAADSERLRKADNPFYQSYNDGFPIPEEYPNKFIRQGQAFKSKGGLDNISPVQPIDNMPQTLESTSPGETQQQMRYREMNAFASKAIADPRYSDEKYEWIKTPRRNITGLFADKRLQLMPESSWQRDGIYITAVRLRNTANQEVNIDYQNIRGTWLAAFFEKETLLGQDWTHLYLISDSPFDEVVKGM